MKNQSEQFDVLKSKNQLMLYGYEKYLDSFINIFKKSVFNNTFLLSGQKGIGKSTFAYHLINFLFSQNDRQKYSLENYKINKDNTNFNLISNNIHPNFFLLENNPSEDNIKVDQVRNLLSFLNKTTFSRDIKFVLIDNAEYLNHNSSNALLKALEEPNYNTFFFIVQNSSSKISNTVKSRCLEFNFSFNITNKKRILKNLIDQYELNYDVDKLENTLFFDTPGNLLKYLLIFNDTDYDISVDKNLCILYLIDKYKSNKDSELLTFLSFFIDYYFNDLISKNSSKIYNYLFLRNKILEQIINLKKYNLDKKNLVILLKSVLNNEI